MGTITIKKVFIMEFRANEGKSVNIEVNGKTYARHAIQTHFVQVGESYVDLVEKYVKPLWQPGDLLSSSEKIIGLCQKRVVYKKDMKVGRLARFLSRFASHSSAGIGVDSPWKMQFAIDQRGALYVIWAAICAGFGKLFGNLVDVNETERPHGARVDAPGNRPAVIEQMRASGASLRNLRLLIPEHAIEPVGDILATPCLLRVDVHHAILAHRHDIRRKVRECVVLGPNQGKVRHVHLGNRPVYGLLDLAPELARVGLLGRVG